MKHLKSLLILLVIVFIFNISNAQQCGFDSQREELLLDSNFVELEKTAEKRIQKAIKNKNFSKMAGSVLTIPVAVHVLHLGEPIGTDSNISTAQIQSSIDNLNDYYRGQTPNSPVDFEIEFVLAKRDPSCNATTGINRIDATSLAGYSNFGVNVQNSNGASYNDIVALSSWPQNDYFNVWIVTELDGNNGGFGFQGYAYFYNDNANFHGSVMMSTVFGYDPGNTNGWGLNSNGDNSTVVHEVGHFFNLFHTFQGDDPIDDGIYDDVCPANNTIGVDSDGCADTVPHKRETSSCPVNNSCTGNPWIDNNTINNIMSYYNCADLLTNDQKTRARAAMESTLIVTESKGAIAPDPTYAPPTAVCNINTATNLTNSAGIVSVELNGITVNSNTTGGDGGNIDYSAIDCSDYFEIDTSMSNTINVDLWVNFSQLGIWIDWNDDGDFNDNAEQQHLSEDIPGNSTVPVVLTYPTTIPYGDYVRIRLITELDDRYGLGVLNSACYASLGYGQSEDYTIYVKPLVGGTTYTYNNAWLPSNPVGVATLSDAIVVDAGIANISTNTNCNTITVNPGAALTIDSGVTLTANTVDLNSTSQLFSSLISDGTITGTVNYNKYVSQVGPVGTNDLISAPVVGQTFETFDIANSNLASSGTVRAFAPYDTGTGAYQNYDATANTSTIIDAGIGYRAATTDGSALTFTGTVRTNDVLDVPISPAAAGSGWNLIGNPYPSYIDFATFFAVNSGEFDPNSAYQAIYGYDGDTTNGWTVWNLATIADGTITELLAPGQAFFVKSKSIGGGGLVDFTTAMRTTGSSDDFISGRNSSTNVALSKLNLNSASNSASTQIYFIEGTTRGLDIGYDAGSYLGSASEYSIFSNLVEDNTGLDIAIQSLPYDDFNNVVVPIGIKVHANEVLTISIDETSSLPTDIYLYLEDTFENTITLLNDTVYTFTPSSALNGTGRFYLRYSSTALSIKDNELNNLHIYATTIPKELVVNGLLSSKTEAQVYDIQGRLVLNANLNTSSTTNTIDVSPLSTGIYIVKVASENQVKTQKVVIK